MNKTILFARILGIIAIARSANLANSSEILTGKNSSNIARTEIAANRAFDYQDYQAVLQTYVDDRGLVDYVGLQANREQLDRFNQSLGKVPPETYTSWNQAEQIAFLTNAYNAFTLQSIIDQDPLKDSIRDIRGVWNRRKFNLLGEERTLDNIEHDTLRQDFNEPRIHVALVCAAMSCPPLRNEPYVSEKLEAQLDEQTAKFAQSIHGFSLDRQDNRVYLSSIFKWYGKDFIETYGINAGFQGNEQQRAVLNYFSSQLAPQDLQFLQNNDYQVKYLDYDWSLNKQ
ncbi:DUF547 domain-containing protein [Waterburya agarophytonicola K14]|uniref:DUF547 domain-containing protein n=1 Tax=Waterburya agarophytonicola KI4 TaxID=2874699 RepID=A0A964BR36_9CYAN|nr:DUF547 domain-containing protein [Waterburya agarophytonicola]MCC0176285.1 DUF547 domain-containing protein [Waterburya agarophytonicola KI4]